MQTEEATLAVTDAVILMAGVGSRLGSNALAKPLVSIGGRPLVCYIFEALERAGVRTVHAVLGATSERLAAELRPLLPAGMGFNPILNPHWRKQNGISVLSAAAHVQRPFFLTMGDHLFEHSILEALLPPNDTSGVSLAVDRKIESIFDLDDATKVQTEGDRIVAIGKTLSDYDAIDTGVFLCSTEIFDYLQRAKQDEDCSLSDGIRLMAGDGKVRGIDIGDAWWQDVDTPEMLARAEQESVRLRREAGRDRTQVGVARED
jgi:choline kinase